MTPAGVVASVCVAVSVAMLLTPEPRRLSRLLAPTGGSSHDGVVDGRWTPVVATAVVVGLGLLLVDEPTQALLLVEAGACALAVSAMVRRRGRHRAASLVRSRVVMVCEVVLGELKAGQPRERALERSVQAWPLLEPAAGAERLGADVPEAFRRLAAIPGAEGLARLAASWQLTSQTGAGLATAVEHVLDTARAELSVQRRVESELASARATARLVAGLPLVILTGASGLGAKPWEFLLGSFPGVVCLGLGLACALAGLSWIEAIAGRAARG